MGDWKNYFSFKGRLNRKPYWLMSLVVGVVAIAAFAAIGLLAVISPLFWGLGVPLYVGLGVTGASIAARRLHDRGKSAWWLLVYQLLPLILSVARLVVARGGSQTADLANFLGFIGFCITMWVLVDLGFLKGRPGSNRFGDDPLGPAIAEVFA